MIDFTIKSKTENDYVCQINIILILFEIKCIFIYYDRAFSFLSQLNSSEKRRYTYTKEGIMIYREAIHTIDTAGLLRGESARNDGASLPMCGVWCA